jgi:osmotically-inducible protein OsmY
MRLPRCVIGWLVMYLLVTRPAAASGWIADSWITVKVKVALLTTAGLEDSNILVDTLDGKVVLFGKVPGSKQKKMAEDIASATTGVSEVKNLLAIVPPARAADFAATDEVVTQAATKALREDPALSGSDIHVASVAGGVVVLSGTARNSAEHLRAIYLVRRVSGVRRVQSTVGTAAEDAELDVWNGYELRQDGRGLLDVASDLWLTAEARLRLIADPRVPALDVNVDTRDQTVTLFGIVPSRAAKRAAGEDTKQVAGVREVRNDLQIVPTAKQPRVLKRDREIQHAVLAAIYERPEMKHAGIRATVKNGVVRLTGTAPSQQQRLFAATAARRVPGVRAVATDIRVATVTRSESSRTQN